MFFNWLTTVFPREMRHGWRLVRADLALWLTIAIGFAVAAAAGAAAGETSATFAGTYLLALLAALLVTLTASARFRAAAAGREDPWSDTLTLVAYRSVPFVLAWGLATGVSAAVAVVAQAAAIILLRNTEAMLPASWVLQRIIYWTLLVRFCFVPFVTALHRRVDFDATRVRGLGWPMPFPALAWPLLASSAMSAGLRWRLVPYLVLTLEAPAAALLVPAAVRLPLLVVLQLLCFTALAVLFDFYERRVQAFMRDGVS